MRMRRRIDLLLDPSHDSPLLQQGHLLHLLRIQTSDHGELRLALAVLKDAVHCIERSRDAKDFESRLLGWEAEQWIQSVNRRPLFSFENICALLELDPGIVRSYLDRSRRHQAPRHTAMDGSTPPAEDPSGAGGEPIPPRTPEGHGYADSLPSRAGFAGGLGR